MTTILRIDGSARTEGSVTRDLTDRLVARLVESNPGSRVVTRDLLGGISLLDNAATVGTALPAEDRTAAQVEALAESDALVAEFLEADFVVLGSPIYNFSVPAAVKAYFDLIARAGLTFKYTEEGPVGLVPDRPTYSRGRLRRCRDRHRLRPSHPVHPSLPRISRSRQHSNRRRRHVEFRCRGRTGTGHRPT